MDVILKDEMKCGCFQVTFAFMSQLTRFSAVWGLYIMMFGNYEPSWTCLDQTTLPANSSLSSPISDISKIQQLDISGRNSSDSSMYSSFNATTITKKKLFFNDSCSRYPSCKHIVFEPGSSTIVSEFGLICDKAWIASFIISVEMFAVVPGSYLGGQIGERFGRKVNLYGSTALLSVSIALGIFSVSWEMYAAFCFFIGLGGGGILSTAVVFTMEFLSPWWRAMFASIPVWNASLTVFTLVIVWLRDWRLIHITSASLVGLVFLGVFWVPESVRWLEVHGKNAKAEKVVKRIYRTNNLEFSSTLTVDDPGTPDMTSDEKRDPVGHKTYLDLFRDPAIRSITLKASTAWLCTLLAYLAMGYGVKSLAGDFYVNIIVASVSEVPMMLIIGPVSNKIGRRISAMTFTGLAAIACGGIVVVHCVVEGDAKGFTIKILALVAKACAAAAWCALATMSVELFPTVVRNLGYGFLTLVSRVGGIIAPYLIPQDPSWFAVCFSIMTVSLVISISMAALLPETMDQPLCDTIPEPSETVKFREESET